MDDADLLKLSFGEEYFVFVQLKTLELMMKEIDPDYAVDLYSLKGVFTSIITDEGRHRELIEKTKEFLERRPKPTTISSPVVRYQNPDAWIRPTG